MKRLGFIGFPGSGKTSLAETAAKSGFKAVDSDALIELDLPGCAEKMLGDGREEDFRKVETSVIRGILKSDFQFVAFGGGVHYGHSVWSDIYKSGLKLIYLRSSFENLQNRFAERPLYKKLGQDGYRKLYETRCPLYEKAASFVVDTDERGLNEIWSEVEEIWNLLFQ